MIAKGILLGKSPYNSFFNEKSPLQYFGQQPSSPLQRDAEWRRDASMLALILVPTPHFSQGRLLAT